MFIAALITIAKKMKTTQMSISCAVYTQWNIILPWNEVQLATTWMNSVNFMLTERSQTQKVTYDSTYMKYSEQANAWKLNVDWWLPEAGVLE